MISLTDTVTDTMNSPLDEPPATFDQNFDDPVLNPNFKTVGNVNVDDPAMTSRNVDVFYDDKQAIFNVSLDIAKNEVIAMIGPSGLW